MEASGELLTSVPGQTEGYPMAVVLSQDAINSLFGELAQAELPEGAYVGITSRPQQLTST